MAGLLNAAANEHPVDAVAGVLRRWASEPFDWATDNCGLAVLAYVERARGLVFTPPLIFTGKVDALRFILASGGLETVCATVFGQLGCPATDAPRRGDVGLVDLAAGPTVAICVGHVDAIVGGQVLEHRSLWAAKGDYEVVIVPARPIAAWSVIPSVPCPKP
ncbi:DUF6950 family protein [Sphingomonas sp. ERG5]|uniref:DUF6950 family protein n=1 Tax=Sphingomonas sp. ERG5 TaxID=1381597 RepID=UPI00054BD8CA|nr:hypothetical protein [Sphingomonas sp. ERG5]